jgi:hypothetical protein
MNRAQTILSCSVNGETGHGRRRRRVLSHCHANTWVSHICRYSEPSLCHLPRLFLSYSFLASAPFFRPKGMPSLSLTAPAEPVNSPHSLLPFLQSQSQTTLSRLYQRPSSCLSIFRYNSLCLRRIHLDENLVGSWLLFSSR